MSSSNYRSGLRAARAPLPFLGLVVLAAACGQDPSENLVPVPLPSLDGLPEAAQQQLRAQHVKTQTLGDGAATDSLALAYGVLGQLFLTYDLLDAAAPAFRNAESLRTDDVRWPYYRGILDRQRGDFGAAAARFEQVLDLAPQDVLARIRLAEARLELGQPAAAKRELDAAVSVEPENAFAHVLLGQIAFESNDYEAAVSHYTAALSAQPGATQIHSPLGLAYRNLGDEERSQFHLERRGQAVVQLGDPRVAELESLKRSTAATGLTEAQRLIDAGRYADGIVVLEGFLAENPDNASAYLSLGVARAYLGNQTDAVEAFRQSLRLDSAQSRPHYNLGALFTANGQLVQAEAEFRAAIANDPRHRGARLELAGLLRRTERCQEALQHFEIVLEIAAGDVGARQHLALCHLRLGQASRARDLLEDGLASSPSHLGYLDALARILAASPQAGVRDGGRAVTLAEQAVALRRRTETLETLAMAYAEVGRFDDAIATQREAIDVATRRRQAEYLVHLRENLRRYEARRPCRTPWPEFVYEL